MTASEQVLSELIAKWEMRGKAEIREMLIAMRRRNKCLDWSKAHYTKRIAEHALRTRLSFKMVRKLKGLQ